MNVSRGLFVGFQRKQSRFFTWFLIPLTSVMSITLNHWIYLEDVSIAIVMCGRYSLGLSNEEVYDGLEARLPQLFEQGRPRREQDHRPRYASTLTCSGEADNRHNVAPRQRAPVIHRDSESDNGGAMIEEM